MDLSTSHPDFKKCQKCGSFDHQTRECKDICLRLVLFQTINWSYAEYIKKKIGAHKVTTGFNNRGRIVNWGFAHFHTEEERELASTGLKTMFNEGQILEKILMFNHGPPECCYLCGQVNHLAGDKRHKQEHCPLRRKPPPRDENLERNQRFVNSNPWGKTNQQRPEPNKREDEKNSSQEQKSRPSTPPTNPGSLLMQPQIDLRNSFSVLQTLEKQEEDNIMGQKAEKGDKENKWKNPLTEGTKQLTRSTSSEFLSKRSDKPKENKMEARSRSRSPPTRNSTTSPRPNSPPLFRWSPLSTGAVIGRTKTKRVNLDVPRVDFSTKKGVTLNKNLERSR